MRVSFPWTLQRYIFRELGKTFLLTAAALTGVLGLGGGLMQMIKLGEVTPEQLGRLLWFMLPVAAALTLPIASLFAAAATYGRLSADNEFIACRGGGINLHILFLPALLVSLAAAGVTFCFTNFMLPGIVRNIETFVYSDVVSLLRQRLDRPKGLTLGGRFRISANENAVDASNPNRIVIRGIKFVEVAGDEWRRYGTAQEAHVEFFVQDDVPKARAVLYGLSVYDRNPPRFYEEDRRALHAQRIPQALEHKVKFLTLGQLFYYFRHPSEWHSVRKEFDRLRLGIGRQVLFDELWAQWLADRRVVLSDPHQRVTVGSTTAALLPGGAGIEFYDPQIEEQVAGRTRNARAGRAVLEVERGDSLDESGVRVEAYDASINDGREWVPLAKTSFGPVAIDAGLMERIRAMPDDQLLDASVGPPQDSRLAERRGKARQMRAETRRRVAATINERIAFSISVVVLALLAAALGIVLRGAHMMVAFGISFVPSLLTLVMILAGKQLIYNEPTYALGLCIMWGGIALVGMLDLWTFSRVLRR